MTEQTPGEARLVAVTNVSLGGARHAPGAVFEAPQEIADELIALGAARAFEDDAGGDLESVKGIGPKTAKQLKDVGVADLADLAALDGDDLVRVAEAIDEKADTVAAWRDQARDLRAQ